MKVGTIVKFAVPVDNAEADERRQMTDHSTIDQQALANATESVSTSNYPAIIAGFVAKGIPVDQIKPRENVFTFNAWRALGRTVCKGEHGVKIHTWVPMTKKDRETGEAKPIGRKPRTTTVFHILQTDPL